MIDRAGGSTIDLVNAINDALNRTRHETPCTQFVAKFRRGDVLKLQGHTSLYVVTDAQTVGRIGMSIHKRGNKYVVTNRSGTKVLGTHATKAGAVKQLQAIEIEKHKK